MRGWVAAIVLMCGAVWADSGFAQQSSVDPAFDGCRGEVVSIADLQWPSASILAHIHRRILRDEFDCDAQVVQSDLANVALTINAAQEPNIVPEFWIGRVAAQWNEIGEAQRAFVAAQTFDKTVLEGWFVPQKVIADFPQLRQAANLREMPALYAREKIRFITCPAQWACHVINGNLLRAFGLQDVFDVVVPSSRFEMDQLIGQVISGREPAVFYYWQPNAVLHQFDFAALDMGDFLADAYPCLAKINCSAPQKSDFASEKIGLVVVSDVRGDMPELLRYLRRATLPISTMNELLAIQERGNLSPEEVASHFMTAMPDIWQSWINGPK